jgi:hypothetical protein
MRKKPRDLHHKLNHHRQAGPMKGQRRIMSRQEAIEEQLDTLSPECAPQVVSAGSPRRDHEDRADLSPPSRR